MPSEKVFNFDARTRTMLRYAAITTTRQLLEKSEQELLCYRGFGDKSLASLKKELSNHGLRLYMGSSSELTAEADELIKKGQQLKQLVEQLEDVLSRAPRLPP